MNPRNLSLLVLGAGIMALGSCGDDAVTGPTEGSILIAANTTGSDFDPNGYTVSVNNGQANVIGVLDTVYVTDLEPGDYQVSLAGLANNCTTEPGTNPQVAAVVAGDTVSVNFEVACEVPPPPGGGDPTP
jgi:hypothetical protein